MKALLATCLLLFAGCGDDDGALPPADAGARDDGGERSDGGAPADAGGGGGDVCPAPPADLPTDLVVIEDGPFRRVDAFPLPGFDPRPVSIYLPEGYDPARRYPVIYFTDGQVVFGAGYRTHDAMEALVADGAIEPHIIVGIYSIDTSRTAELTPDADPAMAPDPGGRGDEFAGAIVDSVKPWVDANFSTRCGRASTTIAGFSLGGLMCLHMLMRDPDVFGRGMCMSPSFWWHGRTVLDRFDGFTGALPIRLWIDVGTLESWTFAIVDMIGKPMTTTFLDHHRAIRATRDLAITKGMIFGRDLGYLELAGAEHTPMGIRARMPSVLRFVLSETSLASVTPESVSLHVWHDQIRAMPMSLTAMSTVSFGALYTPPLALTWPNRMVIFTSSDDAIATIDADGVIMAVAPGSVTIRATAMGLASMDTLEVLAPM